MAPEPGWSRTWVDPGARLVPDPGWPRSQDGPGAVLVLDPGWPQTLVDPGAGLVLDLGWPRSQVGPGSTAPGQLANHHDNVIANQQPAALPTSSPMLPVTEQVTGSTSRTEPETLAGSDVTSRQ